MESGFYHFRPICVWAIQALYECGNRRVDSNPPRKDYDDIRCSRNIRQGLLSSISPKNILAVFSCTGVFPFNKIIFTDGDYAPGYATNRPNPIVEVVNADEAAEGRRTLSPMPTTSASVDEAAAGRRTPFGTPYPLRLWLFFASCFLTASFRKLVTFYGLLGLLTCPHFQVKRNEENHYIDSDLEQKMIHPKDANSKINILLSKFLPRLKRQNLLNISKGHPILTTLYHTGRFERLRMSMQK
ncbi:hypothetical protein NQ318_023518 [Aromia moschata]|uniref:Uncharacterized protein n=1 Tax=Aromia moschata TaxID=1265417 RepID=A0AAV8YRV4_9CUCU|nr:hypothetical protein NQ318_023518 [Aromia moschata]